MSARTKLTGSLLRGLGIGKRWWSVTLALIDNSHGLRDRVQRYCDELSANLDKGDGLLLVGANGVGKTSAAVVILKVARSQQNTVYMIREDNYIRAQRDTTVAGVADEVRRAKDADLLLLDDLGKAYRTSSGFAESEIESLLRDRSAECKATIITSNMDLDTLKAVYGKSMYNLFMENMSAHVCVGKDMRAAVAAEKKANQ